MEKHINKLGYIAKDIITGIEGVIESVDFDLYGCIQVLLRYEKENESKNSGWLDISRIEVISEEPVMEHPYFKPQNIDNGEKGPASKPLK